MANADSTSSSAAAAQEADAETRWPLPYYAVIFTSRKSSSTSSQAPYAKQDGEPSYKDTAIRMFELAKTQPGYLGVTSFHTQEQDGSVRGVTISYWESPAHIRAWRLNTEHTEARRLGKERWYDRYNIRVAKVEREYGIGDWKGME